MEKQNRKVKCEKLCMSWLLHSLLRKPSPQGVVDHIAHVLDCKQTVDFPCGELQNRMNGHHTAIQLLLRELVRLCWLTQIQLWTSWLPGGFTMESKSVMSDEGSVVESQGWWMAGKCWQAPYVLVLWWAQGGLWTKAERDNADHNQGKKCAGHRLPRHKGPTLSVFV